VYFAGLYRWVNETLRRCETCQVKKGSVPNQRGLLVSHVTGYPFQKISIDFVGPLPRSTKGNEYMLTVSDCFTRWLEAFPCCQANAQIVVDKLITEIFPRFGVCDQIHSDRGTQFLSDLISEVVAALGISQSSTPSYNPKSNPVNANIDRLASLSRPLLKEISVRGKTIFHTPCSPCVLPSVSPPELRRLPPCLEEMRQHH
jgi:transposase InsO family protein